MPRSPQLLVRSNARVLKFSFTSSSGKPTSFNYEETKSEPNKNVGDTIPKFNHNLSISSLESCSVHDNDNVSSQNLEKLESTDSTQIESHTGQPKLDDLCFYTCCERYPCYEAVVELSQCPNKMNQQLDNQHPTVAERTEEKKEIDFFLSQNSSIHDPREDINLLHEDGDESETGSDISDDTMRSDTFTCCKNDTCKKEDIVVLNICPNGSKSGCVPVLSPMTDEKEYKIKDLTNFLGMKDGVRFWSVSTIEEPKMMKKVSRSFKRSIKKSLSLK